MSCWVCRHLGNRLQPRNGSPVLPFFLTVIRPCLQVGHGVTLMGSPLAERRVTSRCLMSSSKNGDSRLVTVSNRTDRRVRVIAT